MTNIVQGGKMKKKLGSINAMYPALTIILGTVAKGKPDFTTITHVGIMDLHTVSVSIRKEHHCNFGLREHNSFSVNIPSVEMIREVDLCGHISGKDYDKAVNFETFFGTIKTAPLIKGCPINMELAVTHTIDLPHYNVYVGKIINTFVDSEILTPENRIDMSKLEPILFSMQDYGYWNINRRFADAGFPFKSIVDEHMVEELQNASKS